MSFGRFWGRVNQGGRPAAAAVASSRSVRPTTGFIGSLRHSNAAGHAAPVTWLPTLGGAPVTGVPSTPISGGLSMVALTSTNGNRR
jgi:hypothetical protein